MHCDLLSFLASGRGGIDDPAVKCSWPQLKAGGVFLQTLALFTEEGKDATQFFQKQFDHFLNLPTLYPDRFIHLTELKVPTPAEQVSILPAIENASGLCGKEESLDRCFARLDEFIEVSPSPLFYVSLTWNDENRFGGGNLSKAGLKRDGELFLDYLSGKKIAIDLSHTSDQLADGILNHIDKKGLHLIPIASHSNFRNVCDQPRNLTDAFAKEIVKRGGIIGLNFVKRFVGKSFREHVEHARRLGLFDAHCFGADFFCEKQINPRLPSLVPFFYKEFSDARCYPQVLDTLDLNESEKEQLMYRNLEGYFKRVKEGV